MATKKKLNLIRLIGNFYTLRHKLLDMVIVIDKTIEWLEEGL